MSSPTSEDLRSIWVAGLGHAYAVGDHGVALQYDGVRWRRLEELEALTDDETALTSVWGVSEPLEAFVLGGKTIYHLVNGAWSKQDIPAQFPLAALSGSAAANVLAVGPREVWRFDGQSWALTTSDAAIVHRSVWTAGPTLAITGGRDTAGVVRRFDGGSWSSLLAPAISSRFTEINAVWGVGDEPIAVGTVDPAVSTPGVVRGGQIENLPPGAPESLNALWAVERTDIYAAGIEGKILHFDGSAWTVANAGNISTTLYGISGFGPDYVFVVGAAGAIWRNTGP